MASRRRNKTTLWFIAALVIVAIIALFFCTRGGITVRLLQKASFGIEVYALAFSPDGDRLAVIGDGKNAVGIWDWRGKKFMPLEGTFMRRHRATVTFIADGQKVIAADAWGSVNVWRVSDGKLLHSIDIAENTGIWAVAISPDGKFVALESDKRITLWRIHDGSLVRTLKGHADAIRALAFSSSGRWLASGSDDRSIRLWQVSDGGLLLTMAKLPGAVWSLAFSVDERWLAAGTANGKVYIWAMPDGELGKVLNDQAGEVFDVTFSPDGQVLASLHPHVVRLWRVSDGKLLHEFQAASWWMRWTHQSSAATVTFSPDGQLLAVGGHLSCPIVHTLRIWWVGGLTKR